MSTGNLEGDFGRQTSILALSELTSLPDLKLYLDES